jgi:hypothetical protein
MHSTIVADSHPTRFPAPVQYLVAVLNKFRKQLIAYYENYNPKDRSLFTPDVHGSCGVFFENAIRSLSNDNTELRPWEHIEDRIAYLLKKGK